MKKCIVWVVCTSITNLCKKYVNYQWISISIFIKTSWICSHASMKKCNKLFVVPFGIVPKMHGFDCCFSKCIFLGALQTVYNRFLRKCILQIVCNNIIDSRKKCVHSPCISISIFVEKSWMCSNIPKKCLANNATIPLQIYWKTMVVVVPWPNSFESKILKIPIPNPWKALR